MAHFVDGRASLVVGTHTHVPTADYQILPGGTAYLTDAGMCGDYNSILGMAKEEPIRRFLQKTPGARLESASGEGTPRGIAVEIDDRTGLAIAVSPVRIGPRAGGSHRRNSGPDWNHQVPPCGTSPEPKVPPCGTSPEPCSGSGRVSGSSA